MHWIQLSAEHVDWLDSKNESLNESKLPPLHPTWLSIPEAFRIIRRPIHRWANVPCPEAPILPEGWRWLEVGEMTKPGDMMCDYRCEPVKSGIWLMTKDHHPTRRKDCTLPIQQPKRVIHLVDL